ncbi:polyketide synthase dehydratase domain-containing protein, partial [Streptomyces minutiscleroticus]|uniref:polyketide synthase dehydratase domain-containing protein n=1 Tax=Streptomyces minutiscleroticus TaxID=68238 RepID=UPI00331BA52B
MDAGRLRASELPTYPFQHQRYWLETRPTVGDVGTAGLTPVAHPWVGAAVPLPDGGVVLTGRVESAEHSWLTDHAVAGTVIAPGAALLDLVAQVGAETGVPVVDELVIEAPVVVPDEGALQLHIRVEPATGDASDGRRAFALYSRPEPRPEATSKPETEPESPSKDGENVWTRHATGFLVRRSTADAGRTADATRTADAARTSDAARTADAAVSGPAHAGTAWPPAGADPVGLGGFYERLSDRGFEYGPAFRALRSAWRLDGEVYAEVALPDTLDAAGYGIHPALLDAALQATNFLAVAEPEPGHVLLPFAWNEVSLHTRGATALRVRARQTGPHAFSLTLTDPVDPAGRPVATVGSLDLRPVSVDRLVSLGGGAGDHLYRVDWTPVTLPVNGPTIDPAALLDLTVAPGADPSDARVLVERTAGFLRDGIADPTRRTDTFVIATRLPDADPGAAAVWGLVRTVQLEQPGRVVLVGVDGVPADADGVTAGIGGVSADAGGVVARVVGSGEVQVVWRAGRAWVPRLVRAGGGSVG